MVLEVAPIVHGAGLRYLTDLERMFKPLFREALEGSDFVLCNIARRGREPIIQGLVASNRINQRISIRLGLTYLVAALAIDTKEPYSVMSKRCLLPGRFSITTFHVNISVLLVPQEHS